MKRLNIFISRTVSNKSPFVDLLKSNVNEKVNLNIVGQSGISFSPLPFLLNKNFDACCFYSKRAVEFFFDGIGEGQQLLKNKFIIAFGPATAAQLKTYAIDADLTGSGKAADLAKDIVAHFDGASILFPQAKNSKRSLNPFLKDKFDCISLAVYANEIQPLPKIQEFDFLVFTSPLNVDAFLVNNSLHGKIVAIGQTTAAYLKEKTKLEIITADESTEKSLASSIVKMLNA